MATGIITSREEGCFQWTIQNFKTMRENCWICSPKFTYNGVDYYINALKLMPTHICVMFSSTNFISPDSIYFTFQLRTGCNTESELHVSTWNYEFNCFESTISFKEFLSKNTSLPFPEHLTILLWMRELNVKDVFPEKMRSKRENISENAIKCLDEEKNLEYDTLKKLQNDLEKLFLSKEDTDVTLEVQQEEFLAHKAILRARSPVFYAMFSHEMSEARSGVVTISDCDPETFPDFLMYLYTGNTQHISENNVCHLYTVSDKYEVEELKGKCSEFMKNHISVETFCDFISVALKHDEEELIRVATAFFCRSAVEITKTVKWQRFLQENSTVGNELFQKALLKQNNI